MKIEKNEFLIGEFNLNKKIKVYSFKTGEEIRNCFLYIPSFNYSSKDTLKFFNSEYFDNESSLCVTFDFVSKIHKKAKNINSFIMNSLLDVVSWIISSFNDIKIYLLAESWSCAIATNFYKEYHHRFEKMILWNFPSAAKFKEVFKRNKNINVLEVKNRNNKKKKIKNGYKYNTKIYNIYSKKYVQKLIQFNLISINKKFDPLFKNIDSLFSETWKYLFNNNPDLKINLIESSNDELKSEYMKEYQFYWKDNIHFIDAKHIALMNFNENKNLFNKINEIIEK